jgi:hypothetical protein
MTCHFTKQEVVCDFSVKCLLQGRETRVSTTTLESDLHLQGKDANFLQLTVVGASHLHKVCATHVGGSQEYEECKMTSSGVSQRLNTHLSILCCLKY